MNKKKKLIEVAKRTVDIEIDALMRLKEEINTSFVSVAIHIYETPGRVVVTGVGKSALIAQKIVATMNSTGTPAIFMHAADAIHGDLGMIRREDVVLLLSKSGETSEIKVLVPLLRQFGNKLVGMVSRPDSFLALQSDHVLLTPIDQEADPNNLAPTASTTAQLAMGDALAMALLHLRGFSPGDFAQFHPGGSLGKQLYLKVSDLYPQNDKPAVQPGDSIRTTIIEMTTHRLGATAVVDENKQLMGVITDGDLRRMLESGKDVDSLQASDIMSPDPKTAGPDELALKAFEKLRNHNITQLIVSRDGEYLGMIHLHDLIREGFV